MFLKQICNLANTLARHSRPNSFLSNSLSLIPTKYSTSVSSIQQNVDTVRKEIIKKVDRQIENQTEGRLFAIVHLCGKQFKITAGDIILVEGYWPPTCGDKITLDKVLVAGGADFSLIGRPLLQKGLVYVEATIVEKTLSHTRTHFRKKRRKQYTRINFYRSESTMIMINSIEMKGKVGQALVPESLSIF